MIFSLSLNEPEFIKHLFSYLSCCHLFLVKEKWDSRYVRMANRLYFTMSFRRNKGEVLTRGTFIMQTGIICKKKNTLAITSPFL
jgi:hypothetical protein